MNDPASDNSDVGLHLTLDDSTADQDKLQKPNDAVDALQSDIILNNHIALFKFKCITIVYICNFVFICNLVHIHLSNSNSCVGYYKLINTTYTASVSWLKLFFCILYIRCR
ncbi:hypothetical protein I3760_Q002500 [Carya illinoinensis]|nr:hypothetical protein I3760_Q002500 [Carya illinoinensis]